MNGRNDGGGAGISSQIWLPGHDGVEWKDCGTTGFAPAAVIDWGEKTTNVVAAGGREGKKGFFCLGLDAVVALMSHGLGPAGQVPHRAMPAESLA